MSEMTELLAEANAAARRYKAEKEAAERALATEQKARAAAEAELTEARLELDRIGVVGFSTAGAIKMLDESLKASEAALAKARQEVCGLRTTAGCQNADEAEAARRAAQDQLDAIKALVAEFHHCDTDPDGEPVTVVEDVEMALDVLAYASHEFTHLRRLDETYEAGANPCYNARGWTMGVEASASKKQFKALAQANRVYGSRRECVMAGWRELLKAGLVKE